MPEKLDPEHKSLIIYNKLVECRVALRCTSQFSSKTLDLKSGTIICLLDCIAYTKGSKEGNNTDGFLIRVLAPTGDVMRLLASVPDPTPFNRSFVTVPPTTVVLNPYVVHAVLA